MLSIAAAANAADLVIFSYNRPMQLYALCESIEKYVTGLTSVQVISRAENERYARAYQTVQKRFPWLQFIWQNNPPHDFKNLTMQAAFKNGKANYILFAVDDIIVKDHVDLKLCVSLLEEYKAYVFLLRLGSNINYCYSMNIAAPMPRSARPVQNDVYLYQFAGDSDWNYPNTLDLGLYRKQDILTELQKLDWKSPNTMEGSWAAQVHPNRLGMFFELSKMVNIPLNIVGEYRNRNMAIYSDVELLDKFEQGFKIDIQPLDKIINKAPHMEYNINFIEYSHVD